MTVQGLTWVMDFSKTGGTDRLLMFSLGHHADNEGGFVAVSRKRLAAETLLSEITVKRIIDRLLISSPELAEVDAGDAPDWWLAYRPDRRPRLLCLPLFAATRTGVTNEPPRGGATGARRGRDGGHPQAPDLPKRDAKVEGRREKEEILEGSAVSEPPIAPEPSCLRCFGKGTVFNATGGFDVVCSCCDSRPYVASVDN